MNATVRGYMAALVATVIWSGNFIVARGVADVIPPVQLNFWRWVVALACILPFCLRHWREDWRCARQHWGYMLLIALLGITLLNTLIYKAGQTTGSLNMGLLLPTAPVLILVLARIIYGEPMSPRRVLGVGIVLCGVLFLVSRGSWENLLAVRFTSGDLWALGGVVSFALYSLFMRHKPDGISTAGFNAIIFGLGIILSLPALSMEMYTLPEPRWTTAVWGAIVYIGVGCSFIAYLLWTRAIGDIGPVSAGIVYYTIPLFVAVEGVYFLQEQITLAHIAGGGLIVCGILTATLPGRRPAVQHV